LLEISPLVFLSGNEGSEGKENFSIFSCEVDDVRCEIAIRVIKNKIGVPQP
jgi:hypothetical protein